MSSNPNIDRIITHMNNDHHDSLVRYLEHYCQVSGSSARHARMTSMALTHIGLTTSKTVNDMFKIPLDPPLASFSEARDRLLVMDKTCIAALGRDEITVKEFRGPKGVQWVVFVACVLTFVTFSRRANLQESTAAWPFNRLAAAFPNFFAFCYNIQPPLIYSMTAVHLAEVALMDLTRLKKHSVPRGSRLWWQWIVSTFIYGFGNFQQMGAIVKEEREKRAIKKH